MWCESTNKNAVEELTISYCKSQWRGGKLFILLFAAVCWCLPQSAVLCCCLVLSVESGGTWELPDVISCSMQLSATSCHLLLHAVICYAICCCFLLFVVCCCCVLPFAAIWCSLLAFAPVCVCLLMFIVGCFSMPPFAAVGCCLLLFAVCCCLLLFVSSCCH